MVFGMYRFPIIILDKRKCAHGKKLKGYLGKHIKDICPLEYVGTNNCAHFVAHAIGIRVGMLCDQKHASYIKSNSLAVSIRVNEILII
jgi:hypothetical protein